MAQEKRMHPEVTAVRIHKEDMDLKAKETADEIELTEEESMGQLKAHEEDFIQGLIDAAGYVTEDTQRIEIIRDHRLFFAFTIRPLSEEEYNKCKKKHTKYVRNRQFGMKMPDETDSVKYRSSLIYEATVEEDRRNLWDNKDVWEALKRQGMQIVRGLDVIEYVLKAGEKDRVLEAIDKLSGYEDNNLEEVVKN